MNDSFECPVCGGESWEEIERYRYRRGEQSALRRALTDYELRRRRILFEVWAPDADELELRSQLCAACGFVCFAPRPSSGERDAGYRLLQREQARYEGTAATTVAPRDVPPLLRRRAAQTLAAVERAAGGVAGKRVLDFGGGSGVLMLPFAAAGAVCHVVDYNERPVEGVAKLGDTLDDLDPAARFDVIVASHVLEHIVDVADTVERLAGFLGGRGVLLAEVPDQVWKGIPIAADPVTHVNFFHLPSLALLLERAGLEVSDARAIRGSYGEREIDVLIAVARRAEAIPQPAGAAASGADAARRLLRPTLATQARRLWRERRLPRAGGVLRRLGLRRGPAQ